MNKNKTLILVSSALLITIFVSLFLLFKIEDYKKKIDESVILKKEISILKNNKKITENLFQGKRYLDMEIKSQKSNNYNISKFYLGELNLGNKKETFRWSYIEEIEDKIIIISASGQVYFFKKSDLTNKIELEEIKSNIQDLQDLNNSHFRVSVKDIFIDPNKDMFVSLITFDKKDKSCHKISIIKSDFNTNKLNFETFFEFDECVIIEETPSSQNGGRMVDYKDNKLLFTIGDFSTFVRAQDKSSIYGKIIEIDKENPKSFNFISVGHRNQQGLYYDSVKNKIYSAEHGPEGGDEFNQIIPGGNYGWPVASYGKLGDENKRKINPDIIKLLNSHEKNGFVEPIKYFETSIGISETIKNYFENQNNYNSYFVTSMKNKEDGHSIFEIKFDENNNLISTDRILINDRIRDIIYIKEKDYYLLMLESSYSIGILRKIN